MNVKIIRYKGNVYADIANIAVYLNMIADTEDTDAANRIREAVKHILSLGDE